VSEGGKHVGLQAERKIPEKMGKIVQKQQIVFVARQNEYRGGPQVTVNQVKSLVALKEDVVKGRRVWRPS
jgi:DNA/RNA endonuclease YhcR with UshA esterase domain